MSTLLCHVGLVDITPREAIRLDGFANRVGLSGPIHKPLTSRCLVLSDGESRLCLIVNDLCELATEHAAAIKARIASVTGLAAARVILHSTHTHSAPAVGGMLPAINEAERQYREQLCQAVADNAIRLLKDEDGFSPCEVRFGSGRASIGVNRRSIDPETGRTVIGQNSSGPVDEQVGILQFVDRAGGVLATLFNYACHPVTLGYDSVAVSPDYPGRAREVVEQAWGGTAFFLNGGAGDINPVHGLQTDTAVTDAQGEELGEAVLKARLGPLDGDAGLSHGVGTARLPYRDQDITCDWIDQEVARKEHEVTEFKSWSSDVKGWGEAIKGKLKAAGQVGKEREMCLTAVGIGQAVLFFTQGETFVGYPLALKRAFPDYHLFFMSYSNGESGYLPTSDAFEQKGYEVDQAYIYLKEPSPLTDQAPTIFLDQATALIEAVCRKVAK